MKSTTLSVNAIYEGTVIDHILAGQALRILRLLKLESGYPITLGLNLHSSSMGLKDLIKIESVFLTEAQTAQIALFSPMATVNVIHNYEICSKYKVTLPEEIEEVLQCPNPLCITQQERISARFSILDFLDIIRLRCHFCEKIHSQEEVGWC